MCTQQNTRAAPTLQFRIGKFQMLFRRTANNYSKTNTDEKLIKIFIREIIKQDKSSSRYSYTYQAFFMQWSQFKPI